MTDVPVGELVGVERADVYKAGELVARLVRHTDRVEFSYLPTHFGGPAVASTLPSVTTPVVTVGRAVPAFFAGLLPEGRRLTALRTALKTSADDDFSMLLAIGGDAVGDVQIVPEGTQLPSLDRPVSADDFGSVSFTEIFARATGRSPDRGGLAGVQDKVSGRMITVPVAARGAAYVLKLDPPEFPHLVANEHFFLHLARECGIPVVADEVVHDRDGRPGLLVERFDRTYRDGHVVALAVEDGCQAAGRYPADKYALDTEQVFARLADICGARPVALRALFRQLIVALVTGNGDLHAKNVSIVERAGEWQISPAYDLPSSYPYGDTTLAMAIRGSRESQVSRSRLLELAAQIGLPERAARLILDDLIERLEPWTDRLGPLPFDDRRKADLRRLMIARLRLLRN